MVTPKDLKAFKNKIKKKPMDIINAKFNAILEKMGLLVVDFVGVNLRDKLSQQACPKSPVERVEQWSRPDLINPIFKFLNQH